MFINARKLFSFPQCPNLNHLYRNISSSEVSTALRPFYFAVHPDLFGRYPQQRQVNEESLKQLSAHLEALLQQHRILSSTPRVLPFYIRESNSPEKRGNFNLIQVPLEKTIDTKAVVKRILESCELSTEFVDKIVSTKYTVKPKPDQHAEDPNESPFQTEYDMFQFKVRKAKENESLKYWLEHNIVTANVRTKAVQELREEVKKLQESVKRRLNLKEINYDCGWNVEHFRGCLKSLEKVSDLHPNYMSLLDGRILVFAAFTGVSLDGHIMLFTGDVPRNWLELIKNIPKHDAYLKKLPSYEYALSQVLRNIRVGRRKFMPKAQAMAYAAHLRKITTSLLDYLGKSKYPKTWPEDLSQYEIVVESEAGPVMVSPTGQLIVPATCPGSLLVDFLTTHMQEALEKEDSYKRNKYVEKDLHAKCIAKFGLLSLTKDDSVTPDRMILCLEKIVNSPALELTNVNLNITTYYSVLTDGTVCIPWDWKN